MALRMTANTLNRCNQRSMLFSSSASATPAVDKTITNNQQEQSLTLERRRKLYLLRKNQKQSKQPSSTQLFINVGLPFILFSLGAAWVVKNAIQGKLNEHDAAKGKVSKSERQARMEQEHSKMMKTLNKIRRSDFDNTKRIERPEEVLERRKRERERRNVWYRRWGRWIIGGE